MTNWTPKITVLMPVYNEEKFLKEAIESILNQTFYDFEFLIIDDGSEDGSHDIIQSYQDERIILISRKNHGLAYSLNEGIEKGRGKFIARMDGDDISLPQRLKKQDNFLETHADIGIVGTWAIIMTENGEDLYLEERPLKDMEIRKFLMRTSPFFHGSVMFRRDLFESCGPYPQEFKWGQDWVLWHRFAAKTNLANIGEPLYKYRMRPGGAINRPKKEKEKLNTIIYRYLEKKRLSSEDLFFLESLGNRSKKRRDVANYFFKCGNLFLQMKKDHLKARGMLKRSLQLYPFNIRSVIYFLFTFLTPEMFFSLKNNWKRFKSFIQGYSHQL